MSVADLLLLGIVLFVLIDFSAGMVIDYLNEREKGQPLSPEGAEIFNPDEYAKSMAYGSAKYRFEMLTNLMSTVVILAAIIMGWFAWLDGQLRDRLSNNLLITVAFIGILILISTISNLPISYYSTFVIEEEFGFNKSTKKLFFQDSVKQLMISLALGLPLIYAVAWIYQELQSQFWIVAWIFFVAISLFMFIFGTRIFLPMFNKLKPLPDGELRTAVEDYCQTQGFPLSKLYEMDAKRTALNIRR